MAAATVTTHIAPVTVSPPVGGVAAGEVDDVLNVTETAASPDGDQHRQAEQKEDTTVIATTFLIDTNNVVSANGEECDENLIPSSPDFLATSTLSMPKQVPSAITQLPIYTDSCRSILPLVKLSHSSPVATLAMIQFVDSSTQTDALCVEVPQQLLGNNTPGAITEVEDENMLQTSLAISNMLDDESHAFYRNSYALDVDSICDNELSRSDEDERFTKFKSISECDNYQKQTLNSLEMDNCSLDCVRINDVDPSLGSSDENGLEYSLNSKTLCEIQNGELLNDFQPGECTCNAATHLNCSCDETTANCSYKERIVDYDNFRIIEHVIDCSHEGFCKHNSKMHCTDSWKAADEDNGVGSKELNFACQELVAFIGESYKIIDNAQSSTMTTQEQSESKIPTMVSAPSRIYIDEGETFCADNLEIDYFVSDLQDPNQINESITEVVDDNNNRGRFKDLRISESRNKYSSEAATFTARSTVSSPTDSHSKRDEQEQLATPSMTLTLKALKSKLTPLAPSFHPTRKTQATTVSSTTGSTSSIIAHEQTAFYYQQQPQPSKKKQHFLQQTTTTTMMHTSSLLQHPHAKKEQQRQSKALPMIQQSFAKNSFQHQPQQQQQRQQQLAQPLPQNQQSEHNFVTSSIEHQQHCAQNGNSLGGVAHIHLHSAPGSAAIAAAALATNSMPVAVGNPSQPPQLFPVQVISLTAAATTPCKSHNDGAIPPHQESSTASTVVAAVGNGTTPWPLLEATPIFINSNGEFRSFCPTHGPPPLNTAAAAAVSSNGMAFNQSAVINLSQHPHIHNFQQAQTQPLSQIISTAPAASTTSIMPNVFPAGSINATNRILVQQQQHQQQAQIKGLNQNSNQNHRHHHQQQHIQHQHLQSHYQNQQQQQQQLESVSALQIPGKGKLYRAFKGQKCFGGKNSKERITVMVASNMSGSEKLKLLVIGKSKNPRCFKGIKSLDVDYEYNKKAWMTSEIYDKWLKKLDKVFVAQNRKILLFVDNCPAHPKNEQANLKNIKLQYFPPNLTSVLQPMDQGIIQNLKQHYRKRIVMKVLAHMEEPTPTTVSLLDAIRDLNKTWNLDVKPQTISNCFRKAGFAKGELMQNATTDDWDEEDDLPLSELKQIWTTYRTAMGTDNVSFDDYVDIDDGVQTMGFPTDEDILDSVMENLVPSGKDLEEEVSSESEVETTTETIPTFNQAYSAIQTIRNFTSSKENIPNAVHASINVVEHFIEKEKWSVFKQKKITNFFQ